MSDGAQATCVGEPPPSGVWLPPTHCPGLEQVGPGGYARGKLRYSKSKVVRKGFHASVVPSMSRDRWPHRTGSPPEGHRSEGGLGVGGLGGGCGWGLQAGVSASVCV